MSHLIHDLRVAARALLKTPAFLVVSILTLGLGIGATTAIYSLVKRVALDPLPYPAADRLVRDRYVQPGDRILASCRTTGRAPGRIVRDGFAQPLEPRLS